MKAAFLLVLCLVPFVLSTEDCKYKVNSVKEYDLTSLENTDYDYTVNYDPKNAVT
jgi:hypothetical protein